MKKLEINIPDGFEIDLEKSDLKADSPVVYYKESEKELVFPLVAKSVHHELTVLFTSKEHGTIIIPNGNSTRKAGYYSKCFVSCNNSEYWKILKQDVKSLSWDEEIGCSACEYLKLDGASYPCRGCDSNNSNFKRK